MNEDRDTDVEKGANMNLYYSFIYSHSILIYTTICEETYLSIFGFTIFSQYHYRVGGRC